jgi:probable phosphoglycerate mutase
MSTTSEIVVHIDGGSRGNPGPAAYGVAFETSQGKSVASFGKYIGRTTNNVAEYNGLLAALEYALAQDFLRLRVLTDSELMAKQIMGQYKVKSADLKPLFDQAKQLISRFESFSIRHVYREENREADRLANEAMDNAASGKTPKPPLPAPETTRPPARASAPETPIHTDATYERGALRPREQLNLFEGEEVQLEIRRKK